MESGPNAGQVLMDLWLSILKVMGRTAIQQQLLIGLIACVLAWLLARWIVSRMRQREAAHTQALREQILADARTYLAESDSQDAHKPEKESTPPLNHPDDLAAHEEQAYFAMLLQDEKALDEAVNQRRGPGSRVRALVQQVLFPLLAIGFLYVGYVYAVAAGWYSGLIVDLIMLFLFYALYRLLLGIAYAVGNQETIAYFHHRLFGPLVFVVVLLLALDLVGDLTALSSATVLPLADGWLTLGMLFYVIFGFYLWIMGLSLVKDLILAAVGWRPTINAGSLDAGLTLIQYSLVAIGLFGALYVLQVNTAAIAAITGGLSIGVGFALQDVLKNFLGGIIVLFEGSVRPGDWVEIAGTEGAIDKLSIRSTVVRSFDNVEYIVPNQDWLNSTVTTFTRSSRLVRTRVEVGVSYNSDPHLVQALLVETAAQHPDVLPEPPPLAPLVNFGPSSLDFTVLAWVEDATIKGKVAGQLRLQIWDMLKANNIEIPYPQQDVHIRKSMDLPAAGTVDADRLTNLQEEERPQAEGRQS